MRTYRLALLASSIFSHAALAQVSLQSVIDDAVDNPNDSAAIQRRSREYQDEYTQQLLNSIFTDEPQDFQGTYDRYYGPDSGYQQDLQDFYEQEEAERRYRRQLQQEEADRRYAAEQAEQRRRREALSASRPDQARQQVQSASPNGYRTQVKRAGFRIEEHDASDIDLLEQATGADGVINVNAIPDSTQTPANNWTLDELQRMSDCCPASANGVDWMSVYAFCQKTQFVEDRDGDGYRDQIIELFAKGSRNTPNGQCNVGPKVANPFLDAQTQGF